LFVGHGGVKLREFHANCWDPRIFSKPAEPELFFRYFKKYLFVFRFHFLDVYGFLAGNMPVILDIVDLTLT